MALHHYTTLHQLIHLAALHHLRNVIPVDTSYSWRYSTIYTTLYQSIHLFPDGITPFTQRYISQYIFSFSLQQLHNTLPFNTGVASPSMWQGNTLLLRAQNSAATGRRPKPVNSSHQDSVQPWPIKCTQTLPSLAKHATDRATPLSGVRKTCTRKESSLITLSGDFRLLLLISSGFRKTCNIKGHR